MTPARPEHPSMADRLVHLAGQAPAALGLGSSPGDGDEVRLLGHGESFAAWLLEAGEQRVVVRIARRPVEELPRPMQEEFHGLSLVPEGIGPQALVLEESVDNPLGAPYMVVGFVPGRVLPPGQWTPGLVQAHAQQMARLHAQRFDRCGELTTPEEERRETVDIAGQFAAGLEWWSDNHPGVMNEPDVTRLARKVGAYLQDAQKVFNRLESFALIHGDLLLPNILVEGETGVRYIDWEWSEIGDPAQDLAYLGGRITVEPWHLPMTRAQTRDLIEVYLAASEHRAATGTVEEMMIRCDAWEVYERFLTSLHHRSLLAGRPDLTEQERNLYASAAAHVTRELGRRFG
ncbi:phosphotransferase [Kocuria carniphila]|nr:phosphotransferase [Kocuria sp. WRN011]